MEHLPTDLLLAAYENGYFPMADPDGYLAWYRPDPRAVLFPERLHVPRRLRRTIRSGRFRVDFEPPFESVVRGCADREETWLSEAIIQAFLALHRAGHARAVAAFDSEGLAGGIYGLVLGGAFFAESMFHRRTDASSVALVGLVDHLRARGFAFMDVQFVTEHLARFGVEEIAAAAFDVRLAEAIGRSITW